MSPNLSGVLIPELIMQKRSTLHAAGHVYVAGDKRDYRLNRVFATNQTFSLRSRRRRV